MPPKVFVSHASEDKDRFVINFAKRLRENGIDAWIDKWEMYPGDSLVDKIFEEGIKEAKAVIVVLSSYSVDKPWVKEELNAGFIKRINSGSKLIPVIIDECNVPTVLETTLWEKISDLSSYDHSFNRIVASIFGTTDKPPLGAPPQYISSLTHKIAGLNKIDSFVLFHSCTEAINAGHMFIEPSKLFLLDTENYIPESELKDALEILDEHGYIKLTRFLGGGLFPYQITTFGFEEYAQASIPEYENIVVQVISAIVNDGLATNVDIEGKLNKGIAVISHILGVLESRALIKQAKAIGGHCYIVNISASLKRLLHNG